MLNKMNYDGDLVKKNQKNPTDARFTSKLCVYDVSVSY